MAPETIDRRADEPRAEAQELLDALGEAAPPDLPTLSAEQGRALLGGLFTPDIEPESVVEVEERTFQAYARDIRVRTYNPEPGGQLPAVVYFHGGGWVAGNLDTHDSVARTLANGSNAVVVSVDYRKAPEHPFPAAVEDAYEATKWVEAHAEELGAGGGLAVAGESAGGNLATVVAQMANEKAVGAPELDHQVLFYPVTNHSYDTPSYEQNHDGYFLTRRAMVWFWSHYLRDDIDGANVRASPLRGRLDGLPPATVFTAGFDPLRDEGFQYVEALEDAGVEVSHTNYEAMIHDFANMHDLDGFPGLSEASSEVLEEASAALREAF